MRNVLGMTALIILLGSCDGGGYDMNKYQQYKSDGELQDAVHEWIGSYVENYCRVNAGGSISCS